MSKQPLMPKATAVWLIDNTALAFDQIAVFCQLHELEVQGIADGDVAAGIKGLDPLASGQLTREEIERGEANSNYHLQMLESNVKVPEFTGKKRPKYTPLSRRQERPDAIAWLVRNHPELSDGQISKLVGTTKPTIDAVRDRTHWNSANIKPVDPVTLGLSRQIDLDEAVRKAARKLERERKARGEDVSDMEVPVTLAPVEDALVSAEEMAARVEAAARQSAPPAAVEARPKPAPVVDDVPDADSVFANFSDRPKDAVDDDSAG